MKIQRWMCALFAVMVCASVNAQTSGNCGYPNAADVQWSYDGGTLTFTGTGAMNMYSEDYPQAPWWNDYYETATTVVVGEGITTIPHWAFAMFEHLTSVSLPSTLTTIGKAAFEECAFTTINLPEGLETIGDYAFQMTPLTSVTIPSTVTSIGEVAFQANDALTYVICLAATPPTMGDNVFQACSNLTGIFVPAAKVDTYKATDGWSDYATLIRPISGSCGANAIWSYSEGVMIISGSGAMDNYTEALSDNPWNAYRTQINQVVVGGTVTSIGNWAFYGCTNLNSVTIGDNVHSIGNEAFGACGGITRIYIPNGVQTIGIMTFDGDSNLEYVCIGSGITTIGNWAFADCSGLKDIGCYASTPPTVMAKTFNGCSAIANVYVPSAKISDYKAADNWSNFGDKIKSPSGTCGENGAWSFEMATGTLTIGGTEIGGGSPFPWESNSMGGEGSAFNPENAEGYPQGIKQVVIGEGITEIPASAFYMEIGITDVKLPSTLTAIGMDAFGECENIETITSNATTPPTLADAGNEDYVFYVPNEDWSAVLPIPTVSAIYVPAASVDAYKAADGWSAYAAKINAKFFTAVGDYQWATFYDDSKDYEVDANTTVYKASLTGATLTLTEIGGNQIITAGNAVVLKSTSAPVLTETATASTADFSGNELHGSASPVASDGTLYALSYKSGTLGFFKVKSGTSIPAGKAYLSTADAAREYFEFTYGDDATSIKSVASSHQTIANGQYYDMQGRKVFKPTKGLYIVNGKKVIVK